MIIILPICVECKRIERKKYHDFDLVLLRNYLSLQIINFIIDYVLILSRL